MSDFVRRLPGQVSHQLGNVKVLADAGVIRPMRPDRCGTAADAARAGAAARPPERSRSRRATRTTDDRRRARDAQLLRGEPAHDALASSLSDAGVVEGDIGIMCRNHRGFIEATMPSPSSGRTRSTSTRRSQPPAHRGREAREATRADLRRGVRGPPGGGGQAAEALRRVARLRELRRPDARRADPGGRPGEVVPPQREGRASSSSRAARPARPGASRGNPQSLDPAVRCSRRFR